MSYLIGTSEELIALGSEIREQHSHLIVITRWSLPYVGHKCKIGKRSDWWNPFGARWDGYRYQTTKHCKVCHTTWPREVQVAYGLLK